MSAADVEVAREIYEAFNRGDTQRVRELFDDDIEWHEPEGYFVPEARGTTRGNDAVFAIFGRYPEMLKSFAPTPEEFYDAGDGVVFVTGTQRAEAHDGRTAEASFINLWRIRDGRATLHRSWSDTKTLGSVTG